MDKTYSEIEKLSHEIKVLLAKWLGSKHLPLLENYDNEAWWLESEDKTDCYG